MINYIWAFFILCGIIYGLFTGNISTINNEILLSSKTCVELLLKLIPMIALWNGIVSVASVSGLLNKFSKLLSPILSKLFKDIPKNSKALDYIASNIAVNMVGLGSAATPLGLKAMKELQKLNKNKDTATDAMITFLVLNTSGVTLIPTTVISMRMLYDSNNPTSIIITSILATICSTFFGLMLDYYYRRKRK